MQPECGPGHGPSKRQESRLESALEAKILLALSDDPTGKAALASILGHETVSGELHKLIKRLLVQDLIEMTFPEGNNSRLQKYRLTAKGRALLD